MTCQDCELRLGQQELGDAVEEHLRECAECHALHEDLRANALALESLRNEELPGIAVKIPRRRRVYPWMVAAAAATVVVVTLLMSRTPPVKPVASQVASNAVSHAVSQPAQPPLLPRARGVAKVEPLKIKMLTPDPDVVIYWLIDN